MLAHLIRSFAPVLALRRCMLVVFAGLLLAGAQLTVAQPVGGTFDHAATGFPLQGAHQTVRCETCHINGIFKGTPRDCATCHAQGNPRAATAKPVNHIPATASCDSCHAVTSPTFGGVVFSHVGVQANTCQSCHDNFHTKGKPAGHIPTNLNCGACHNTMAFLPVSKFDHTTVEATGMQCASCHNNVGAKGMPDNHLPNPGSLGCDVCHQASKINGYTSFSGGLFSHTGISSSCATCHGPNVTNGTYYGVTNIVVMPPSGAAGVGSHLPTSTRCESCHLASVPGGLVSPLTSGGVPGSGFLNPAPTGAMIHAGIAGNCASCHEAGSMWLGMNQYPITVSAPFKGFQTRPQATAGAFNVADAGHPTSGDCSQCHTVTDFSSVTTKPANHIPTTAACASCHVDVDYRVKPTITAIHANSPQTNCAQCHGAAAASFAIPATNFAVVSTPPGHIPLGGLGCENCHVGANSSLSLPVVDGAKFNNSAFSHTGISTNCASCHNGQSFFGVTAKSALDLVPAHIPMGGLTCETCHVNSVPSVLVPLGGATGVGGMNTFAGGQFSHAGIASGCDTCHGPNVTSSTFYGVSSIVVMPPSSYPGPGSHIPASAQCETCHKGVVPAALVSVTGSKSLPGSGFMLPKPAGADIHNGVTGCVSCHEAGNVWMSMGQYPILPSAITPGAKYTGFQTRPNAAGSTFSIVDPLHPAGGECSNCHTVTDFSYGVVKPGNHIPTAAAAVCGSCHKNSDLSVMPAIADIHANAPSTNANCAQCHSAANAAVYAIPAAGFSIVAPPSNHVPMGNTACETCHVPSTAVPVQNNAKFSGAAFTHSGTTVACNVCHGPAVSGSTFAGITNIVVMPPSSVPGISSHIPSSTTCENCHTAPSGLLAGIATLSPPGTGFHQTPPITGAQIHTGVSNNCNSCHEANYVWMGMTTFPITTKTPFTGFQTRPLSAAGQFNVADAAHPASGDCSNCHTVTDFSSTTVKPANHIPTLATASCAACHKNASFAVMPAIADIHANAPSTTINCADCHSAANAAQFAIPSASFSIVAPSNTHMPMGGLGCESCHTGANTSITTLPVGNSAKFSGSGFSHNDASFKTSCNACHVAGLSFQGNPGIVVMPATSPVGLTSHLPTSTSCESCHLLSMPSAVVAGSVNKSLPGSLFKLPAPTGAMIHAGITKNCSSCHEAGYLWMSADQYPINSTAPFKGFQTRPQATKVSVFTTVDSAHPVAGDCSTCHTVTDFSYGVTKPSNHIPTATTATCQSCHTATNPGGGINFAAIPSFTTIHANAPSTTTNCAQCHSAANAALYAIPAVNFAIIAPTNTHMPMGALGCENCHTGVNTSITSLPVVNGASFKGSGFSHNDASFNSGCNACHMAQAFQGSPSIVSIPSTTPANTQGPTSHLPTSTSCESCHLGSKPATVIAGSVVKTQPGTLFQTPVPTAGMIHSGVTGNCASCHEQPYVWLGVSQALYKPTTVAPFKGFQTRPTPAGVPPYSFKDTTPHPVTGDCSSCHTVTDFSYGVTKPSNHIPTATTATCQSCHKATNTAGGIDFAKPPQFIDIHTNAPSTTSNCAQCHSAANAALYAIPTVPFSIVAPTNTHMPMGSLGCESCHTGVNTSITTLPVGNGASFKGSGFSHNDSSFNSSCNVCHMAQTFQGSPAIVSIPASTPNNTQGLTTHLPTSTSCESCHLGSKPATVIAGSAVKTQPGTLFQTPVPTAAMIHAGVTGNCASCHEQPYVWLGVSQALYTPTTVAPFKGFQTRPTTTGTPPYSYKDPTHPTLAKGGDCSNCHTVTDFTTTNKPTNHIPTAASATCASCHTSADFSAPPTLTAIHANAPSSTTNCAQCHASSVAGTFAVPAGYVIVSPATNHIPMGSLSCEACHVFTGSTAGTPVVNGAKFSGSKFTHSGITKGCKACHDSTITTTSFQGTTKIVVMPPVTPAGAATSHIPSSTTCETCHLGSMPTGQIAAVATATLGATGFRTAPPISAQTHTGISSGCSNCHEAGMAWVSSNLYPITPKVITANANYTGFQVRPTAAGSTYGIVDAGHPLTGDCSLCHNSTVAFTSAGSKPTGHIPTKGSCASCHLGAATGDYSVAKLATNTILHTGITTGCISCHTAGTGTGPFAGCATQAACTAPPPITYQPKTMPLLAGGSPTAPSTSTHIPVAGIACEGCHSPANLTSFGPSTAMTHTSGVTALLCKTCHESAYIWYGYTSTKTSAGPKPGVFTVRPNNHHGTQDCKGCHSTSGFRSLIRPVVRQAVNPGLGLLRPNMQQLPTSRGSMGANFDHVGIEPAKCKTCHDGQRASGMPAKHLMVSNSCDACHRTTAWKPAYFNHAGISPNTCLACHNGIAAPAKSAGHFMTARSCDSCHKMTAWLPANYSHVSPAYQPAAGMVTCVSCHTTNSEVIPRQMRVAPRNKPIVVAP